MPAVGRVQARGGQGSDQIRARFGPEVGRVWARFEPGSGQRWAGFGSGSGQRWVGFGSVSGEVYFLLSEFCVVDLTHSLCLSRPPSCTFFFLVRSRSHNVSSVQNSSGV